MKNRALLDGLVLLGSGLAASSLSSFLEAFTIFGSATDFASGIFDGLSVVALCTAIAILVRGRVGLQD